MNILLEQPSFEEVKSYDFDVVIAASGFERRASFQVPQLSGRNGKRVVLAFNNEKNHPNRIENDEIFAKNNFQVIETDGEKFDLEFFETLFSDYKKSFERKELNIYVDYSSMTRNLYAHLLIFSKNYFTGKKVNIYFGYSFAKYEKVEKEERFNEIVEPIFGFCKLSIPSKPTALVICLGNEISRVYGLREFFDATTYLFYSDPKFHNEFSKEVESVNYEIILDTPAEHIYKFPIEDLIYTDFVLENLCRGLNEQFRVVLAPCGPKPFTLLSLINSLKLDNDIEVWRISPGKSLQKLEREPNGQISVLKASFE